MKKFQKLLKDLVGPIGINHQAISVASNLKRKGIRLGIISIAVTAIALVFSYALKATNLLIEQKMLLLGIIVFLLYRGQNILREAYTVVNNQKLSDYELSFEKEILLVGARILDKVAGKVVRYDKSSSIYVTMSNEKIQNTIKRYLSNLWQLRIHRVFKLCEIVFAAIMLVFSIIVNDAIDQRIYIPTVLVFSAIMFLTTCYLIKIRKASQKELRQYDDARSEHVNDLLRVPPITKNDTSMRIRLLSKTVEKANMNSRGVEKKRDISHLLMTLVEVFASYGIVIMYLIGIEWSTISVATIAEISANIAIVEAALGKIRNVAGMLEKYAERISALENEHDDIQAILEVYDKKDTSKPINAIEMPPFMISYPKMNKNEVPFSLESKHPIAIASGEVVILRGASGTGKSTFIKLLTKQIQLGIEKELPSTSRYTLYDERMRFGSLPVYDELFCSKDDVDLGKMKNILTNLHLWQEVSQNTSDVWEYLKHKKYSSNFSNGQKQRLVLAKILYWLDEDIDVVALDECTSGLDEQAGADEADAQRILEYVVKYCNADKKRIVILSTHQNIDEFKQKMSGVPMKEIFFKRGEIITK